MAADERGWTLMGGEGVWRNGGLMQVRWAILVGCVLAPSVLLAALFSTSGKEWGIWDESHYSVVLGTIHKIKELKDSCSFEAEFAPRATMAGGFDPSLHATLKVQFETTARSMTTSSIEKPPSEGATVMAVIRFIPPPEKGGGSPQWFIVPERCTFMPGNSSLVTIDGFDDPKVLQTLKKLQDARAHPDPSPYPKEEGKGEEQGAGR